MLSDRNDYIEYIPLYDKLDYYLIHPKANG